MYLHTGALCASHRRSHRIRSAARTRFRTGTGGKRTARSSSRPSRCRSSALPSPCRSWCRGSSRRIRSAAPRTPGCRRTPRTRTILSLCCIWGCSPRPLPGSYSCTGDEFPFPARHWAPLVLSQYAFWFFHRRRDLQSRWKRPGRKKRGLFRAAAHVALQGALGARAEDRTRGSWMLPTFL